MGRRTFRDVANLLANHSNQVISLTKNVKTSKNKIEEINLALKDQLTQKR